MSNAFSEVYRPKKYEQLIGESQRKVAKALLEKVEKQQLIQEVLLTGPSGSGKTTIARMYIQAIMGDDFDFDSMAVSVNCSSDTGIDMIRENIIGTMHYQSLLSEYRVYFLDEIHGLSKQAQNALLTQIEPLPDHVIMLASTTDPHKVIDTLKSRFTHYQLSPPSKDELLKKAKWICVAEGAKPERKLVEEIADLADGNVRIFDRLLQQVLDGSYNGVEAIVQEGSLIHEVMFKSPNLSRWFQLAKDITSYSSEMIGMGNYAIAVLTKPNNPHVTKRAMAVLKCFGDGLSREVPEKLGFYSKLLQVYQEVMK